MATATGEVELTYDEAVDAALDGRRGVATAVLLRDPGPGDLEALLGGMPVLRVGIPSTPQDAYAMLRAAVADEGSVVLLESRALDRGPVRLGDEREMVGGARVLAEGDDVAVLTWGRTCQEALAAAERLRAEGLSALVVDLRWLAPLDDDAIAAAVRRANHVLVAHEGDLDDFAAELAARIEERHVDYLDAPVRRVGAPTRNAIAAAAADLIANRAT